MRTEIVDITPSMAQQWLTAAADLPQRALTRNRVMLYSNAMHRGQWRVTHQAIAIDPEGILIDGQHRLSAVVMSGKTVRMSVTFDVPRESFDAIDTGQARTTASTLHIAGIPDATATAAAARLLLMYNEISGSRRLPSAEVRRMFSTRDVLDLMGSDLGVTVREAIAPARFIGTQLGKYGARSWLAAGIALIDSSRPDKVVREEFIEKIASGASLSEGNPILTFRKWMVSEFGYERTKEFRGIVGVAGFVKTWNTWSNGHDLKLLRIRPGREQWPAVGVEFPDSIDLDADAIAPDLVEA